MNHKFKARKSKRKPGKFNGKCKVKHAKRNNEGRWDGWHNHGVLTAPQLLHRCCSCCCYSSCLLIHTVYRQNPWPRPSWPWAVCLLKVLSKFQRSSFVFFFILHSASCASLISLGPERQTEQQFGPKLAQTFIKRASQKLSPQNRKNRKKKKMILKIQRAGNALTAHGVCC